jgi:MFS family permease
MMIWKIIYLATFVAGLALAVSSMLHGAERWRRRRSLKQSAVFNPPTVAALAVGIGACGYLLVTRTTLGWAGIFLIAMATGLAALFGMITLMAKWALRTSGHASGLVEEDTHGQIATVSRTITPGESGEITYFAWNKTHVLAATAMDASVIPEGTEVVIDSVEDGVARVELWSVVEQRL